MDDVNQAQFLSTPSARRATVAITNHLRTPLFLSTPSARRATTRLAMFFVVKKHFYPRPPRGGRQLSHSLAGTAADFYPRPPRGGRPSCPWRPVHAACCISIHALREEGDDNHTTLPFVLGNISIHALREEGDPNHITGSIRCHLFLSTPSARRATSRCAAAHLCDVDFYPRPPRGGRLIMPWQR